VIRDEIHIPTVPAAFMLDAQTGYVRLSEFGENTDQELGQALRDAEPQGMKRLVFDLRNNPGGALDQAIKVANRFLAARRHGSSTRAAACRIPIRTTAPRSRAITSTFRWLR
jgi:carboxyl-terminal processing protease